MEEKGAKDRKKKETDLNKKVKAKKLSELEKQEELNLFDQMLENKIKNEIAKRIDKAHLYSFNLASYKSNLSESQLIDWREALNKSMFKNFLLIQARRLTIIWQFCQSTQASAL